jgi:hypothetical protein
VKNANARDRPAQLQNHELGLRREASQVSFPLCGSLPSLIAMPLGTGRSNFKGNFCYLMGNYISHPVCLDCGWGGRGPNVEVLYLWL